MSFLFGGTTPTQSDSHRSHQNDLRSACRTLDRELFKNQVSEKKLKDSMMKHAKAQDLTMCTLKAKELVRLRSNTQQVQRMKGKYTKLSYFYHSTIQLTPQNTFRQATSLYYHKNL